MKRIVVDLDKTITAGSPNGYEKSVPNLTLINKLKEYKANGFDIVISTSRNVRTFEGNLGKINVHTLPLVIKWLENNGVPFDEIYMAKPWCGNEGFYIDDKAIRPDEFEQLSYEEIREITGG